MEPTLQIPIDNWNNAKLGWNEAMTSYIKENFKLIEYMSNGANTKTVIPVLLRDLTTNHPLDTERLRVIQEAMTMDLSGKFDFERLRTIKGNDKDNVLMQSTSNEEWESILSTICYVG